MSEQHRLIQAIGTLMMKCDNSGNYSKSGQDLSWSRVGKSLSIIIKKNQVKP